MSTIFSGPCQTPECHCQGFDADEDAPKSCLCGHIRNAHKREEIRAGLGRLSGMELVEKYRTSGPTSAATSIARTEANRGFRPSQGHLNTTPAASSARVASTRKALSKGAAQGGRGKQAENKKGKADNARVEPEIISVKTIILLPWGLHNGAILQGPRGLQGSRGTLGSTSIMPSLRQLGLVKNAPGRSLYGWRDDMTQADVNVFLRQQDLFQREGEWLDHNHPRDDDLSHFVVVYKDGHNLSAQVTKRPLTGGDLTSAKSPTHTRPEKQTLYLATRDRIPQKVFETNETGDISDAANSDAGLQSPGQDSSDELGPSNPGQKGKQVMRAGGRVSPAMSISSEDSSSSLSPPPSPDGVTTRSRSLATATVAQGNKSVTRMSTPPRRTVGRKRAISSPQSPPVQPRQVRGSPSRRPLRKRVRHEAIVGSSDIKVLELTDTADEAEAEGPTVATTTLEATRSLQNMSITVNDDGTLTGGPVTETLHTGIDAKTSGGKPEQSRTPPDTAGAAGMSRRQRNRNAAHKLLGVQPYLPLNFSDVLP